MSKHDVQPVAWQYQGRDGEWKNFTDEKHRKATEEDGSWPIRALYTHPAQDVQMDAELRDALDRIRYLAQHPNTKKRVRASDYNLLRDGFNWITAALAVAERYAERYRYLRDDPPLELSVRRFPGETPRGCYLDGFALDQAIDDAIASKEPKS